MPLTLTPEQKASFVPETPAAAPAPIALTPEQLASFQPDAEQPPQAINVVKDFSVDQLLELAKQNKTFNPVTAYAELPEAERTPEILAKMGEVRNKLEQISMLDTTPVVSGLWHGDLGETVEGVKQVGGTVAEMAKGGAKWIGNVARVGVGNVAGAAGTLLGYDEQALTQNALETKRAAAESIAGLEAGGAGLVNMGRQVVGGTWRALPFTKPVRNFTPEEKQKDFLDALSRHQIQQETLSGHGPILSNPYIPIAAENVRDLEAAGMPVRPEEVSSLAAGDPLSFMLFGKGLGAVTGGAKFAGAKAIEKIPGAEALVSKLPSAADVAQAAGGRIVQGLGKTAEGGAFVAEKTAPVVGAIGGAAASKAVPGLGEIPIISNVLGAGAGYKLGKSVATDLHKLGQNLKGISAAGKNIAQDTITGSYEQLAKDAFRSVPAVAGEVAKGAVMDLALAAAAETPEERQGVGMGVAFGLGHGLANAGRNAISGQIISPRSFAGNASPRPVSAGADPAFAAMHKASFDALAPGKKVFVNSVQDFTSGINPTADIFVATNPETAKTALIKAGVSEAQAETMSQQKAATFEHKGRKVVIMIDKPADGGRSGVDSAPHEAGHAIENAMGEDNLRQLDAEIIASNDIEKLGREYAQRLGPEPGHETWQDVILDKSGWGNQDAVEKRIQDAITQYHDEARKAGNEPPTDAEIRQLVENQVTSESGFNWRNELTPAEQNATAERFMAREIRQENFDAWFKRTGSALEPGNQMPEVLARWLGKVMTTLGANPIAGRVSEGLKVPLSLDTMKATAAQAKGTPQRPVIEPTLPKGGPVGLPRTPVEQEQAATDAAEIAKTAPDVALPGAAKTQREILGVAAEAIANRSGIKINYLSAPEEPAAAISSKRSTRREMIELYRRMPEEARKLWEKTFFPETVTRTKEGKYQVQGWAPEVFAANAQKLAEVMAVTPEMAKLSPYEVDATGKTFTKNGWLDLYRDVSTFVKNQQAGFTGSGEKLVVPGEMQGKGFFKPPQRTGQEMGLDQNRADFVNMLFNFKLPDTNRLRRDKFPLNVAGQEVSKATMPGRLVEPLTPRPAFEGPIAQQHGVEGRTIQEVNPLRRQFEQAAKDAGVAMPSFIEAVQKLNLERILEADHAPEVPEFRGNTLTLSAGFMPAEAKREIKITGPDGKEYRAMFDGYQDFSQLGMGKVAQITALEDLPGSVNAKSTTYSKSLEKAGYKLPTLDAESGPKVVQFSPADSAGVVDHKEIAEARKLWAEKGTQSPYFQKWFEGSKVADENGDPIEVYHGTTHKFDEFTTKRANPENFLGSGHYFSTDVSDATGNYAGKGPDLTSRIERLTDQYTDRGLDLDLAQAKAERALKGRHERTIAAYLNLKNPVVLDKKGGTRFEYEYDEATGAESGTASDLYRAILETAPEFSADGQKLWEAVTENGIDDLKAYDVLKKLTTSDDALDITDAAGNVAAPEFARKVFETAGFDGAVLKNAANEFPNMGIAPNTDHYIAFSGDQVKSVQNRGTFSPSDRRIQFAAKETGKRREENKPLPHALGTGRVPAVHYGNTPELTRLDPELMGSGSATSADQKGLPKTFFFEQGSEFGGDTGRFNTKQAYVTNIDKSRLYDTTQGDPLGYFGGNRLAAERGIQDAGYSGVYVETADGRKVMAMFEAGNVKDIGRADETGARALGPVEQLPGLEPAVRVEGKKVFSEADLKKTTRYFSSSVDALVKKGVLTIADYGDNGYPVERGFVDNKGKWVGEADAYRALNPEGLRSEHVQYMPGGDPRAIRQAAVRDPETGKTYEGYAHFAARHGALDSGISPQKVVGFEDGFMTNGGEFLNRQEAFKRAVELKQYAPNPTFAKLPDKLKQLESVSFETQKELRAQGYDPAKIQYTPGLPDKFTSKDFEKTLKEVRAGKLFGATFNTDGTKWEAPAGEKLDVVSLASLNVPQGKLNVAAVDKFLTPFEDLLDEGNVKLGTFSFSKDGVPMVSIDLNAVVDQKHRANTVKFARDNDQVSVWDAAKGEEVPTGGKGNTKLKSLAELYEAIKPLSKGRPVDVAGIISDNAPAAPRPTQGEFGLGDAVNPDVEKFNRHEEGNMTKSELAARHPESVIPPHREAKLRAKIVESPLYKAAGSEEAAVKSFAKGLVDFAKEFQDHPAYQAGLKWYSEAVPKLKKTFGKYAPMVAEFLAATSPQNNPRQNYAYTIEALEAFKAGKYDRQIKKYLEGLGMLETDAWQAGGAKTRAAFMKDWIEKHNLTPVQSNGAKFGIASNAVLQVMARTWLNSVEGPKVSQFVQNLLGTDHGATIDVWAGNRTMRRIGYSGFVDRWRLLPKNEAAVSDADFAFSQKAFAEAAKQLGILPDSLQGGLWFAEKQLWSDRGYGNLDLGSFVKEMDKTEALQKAVKQRLAAPVQQELLVSPRTEK